jgi:hypothetical protein
MWLWVWYLVLSGLLTWQVVSTIRSAIRSRTNP